MSLTKETMNSIKRLKFNSKNNLYLFVLASSYACSSSGDNNNNISTQIVGTTTGIVTEDDPEPIITGNLDHTDINENNVDDVWQVISTATNSIEGYGTYTIDIAGNWTYTLDNTNTTVNALGDTETLTDSFQVLTEDGTTQTVRITINGANELQIGDSDNNTLSGGDFADTLEGREGIDNLFGGEGNDILNGEADNDFLFGEGGDDILDGGDGNDNLVGGEGNDILDGEDGDDLFQGNEGNDILTGGSGKDRFLYNSTDIGSENIDTITDFVNSEDLINLHGVEDFSVGLEPTLDFTLSTSLIEGTTGIEDISAYTDSNAGITTLYIDANDNAVFNVASDIQIVFSNAVSLDLGDFFF